MTGYTCVQDNPKNDSAYILCLASVSDSSPANPYEFQFNSTNYYEEEISKCVDDLEAKIKSLPADKPVIFVCGTGARSGESYYMVKDVRPELKEVYYVEAELEFNKDGSFKLIPPKN